MSDRSTMLSGDDFAQWVHDALNQLYDSPYLQTHPLAQMLAEPGMGPVQRDQHLRRTLINAIHSLRPEAGVSAQSPRWRAYQILEMRYIEGLSPAEVMHELALSRSTFFREQARMLEALTAALWEQAQQIQRAASASAPLPASREQLAQAEIERLSAHATWEATDVSQLLDCIRPIVEPLARAKRMAIDFHAPQRLSIMRADRVLMRQAILNAITYALDVVSEGHVVVRDFVQANEAGIQIQTWPAAGSDGVPTQGGAGHRQGIGLEVCRRFMSAMGGTLLLERTIDHWEARLAWPVMTPRVLLVIDDNEEFIDLFRRYLAGHNWRVVGALDGAIARQLIAENPPTVIALDVMMPKEDGWDFLMALRSDERTRDMPVIICSVLNEPQLAETLGATAYLPKPITQSALLRVLMPWSQVGANPAPAR
jgi:CheY-like chemotaxis protein